MCDISYLSARAKTLNLLAMNAISGNNLLNSLLRDGG